LNGSATGGRPVIGAAQVVRVAPVFRSVPPAVMMHGVRSFAAPSTYTESAAVELAITLQPSKVTVELPPKSAARAAVASSASTQALPAVPKVETERARISTGPVLNRPEKKRGAERVTNASTALPPAKAPLVGVLFRVRASLTVV
jgi:hypothetical protein